jgi:hypothetical protein
MNHHCPQCGEKASVLYEGYCEECRMANQSALDQHNAQFDRWERLSDDARWAEIKNARIDRACAEANELNRREG